MKLKIRFVKTNGVYFAQRKTWLGWRDITYTIDMGYGSAVFQYTNKSKKKLLNDILDKKYKKCKRHVAVYEYGGLKIY
jgi:hypothetical protein